MMDDQKKSIAVWPPPATAFELQGNSPIDKLLLSKLRRMFVFSASILAFIDFIQSGLSFIMALGLRAVNISTYVLLDQIHHRTTPVHWLADELSSVLGVIWTFLAFNNLVRIGRVQEDPLLSTLYTHVVFVDLIIGYSRLKKLWFESDALLPLDEANSKTPVAWINIMIGFAWVMSFISLLTVILSAGVLDQMKGSMYTKLYHALDFLMRLAWGSQNILYIIIVNRITNVQLLWRTEPVAIPV